MPDSFFLEILPAGADKGSALQYVMESSGLRKGFAFGDQPNDIPFLMVRGVRGYLVANHQVDPVPSRIEVTSDKEGADGILYVLVTAGLIPE